MSHTTIPLRADARRNRERIIEAARTCLAARGAEAQMDEIAAEAGVGVGTLYRHFPTKDALIAALTHDRFQQLADAAAEAVRTAPSAWEGLCTVLERSTELQEQDRVLSHLVFDRADCIAAAAEPRAELEDRMAILIEQAKADGDLRPDFEVGELAMIACALGRVAQGWPGDDGRPGWRRYLAIVLDGLRAHPQGRR